MHLLIHSVILVSWLFTVCAQDQVCKKEDFKPANPEGFTTHDLLAEYPLGAVVRVHCQTGYEGLYKMRCTQGGVWTSGYEECKRKQCGHPGDAPNADFDLTDSSEDFSFGSEVIYRCRPGYVMISRSPIRKCMSQGWSNVIPVCEVLKCPPLEVPSDMQVDGEYLDARAGSVVTLQCKASNMIVDGPSQIRCNNQGQWPPEKPQCKVFKCPAPIIDNGWINHRKEEYDENDMLSFNCKENYRKSVSSTNPTCVKMNKSPQWNPRPYCEEITCQIIPLDNGKYTPPGKTIFKVGNELTVECLRGYWIQVPGVGQTLKKTWTCDKSGLWIPGGLSPQCEEVRCYKPNDPKVIVQPTKHHYKFEEKVMFSCDWGYKIRGPSEAQCTDKGWSSVPACIEISCDPNHIKHAQLPEESNYKRYKLGAKLRYKCLENLEIEHSATCTKDGWTIQQLCTGSKENEIKNGFAMNIGEKVYYSCNDGYKLPHGGWWDEAEVKEGVKDPLPVCIEKSRCPKLPVIPHLKPVKQPEDGYSGVVMVTCEDGYQSKDQSVECKDGSWKTPLLQCLPKAPSCPPPPKVDDAVVMTPFQSRYEDEATVTYKCRKSYEIKGKTQIKCINERWETPPTCENRGRAEP